MAAANNGGWEVQGAALLRQPTAAVAVNGRGARATDAGGNGGSVVQGTG